MLQGSKDGTFDIAAGTFRFGIGIMKAKHWLRTARIAEERSRRVIAVDRTDQLPVSIVVFLTQKL